MDQLYRICNEVLFYVWDPIGVSRRAAGRDEYDSYTKGVLKLLQEGRDATKVANYLHDLRTTSMGLPSAHQEDQHVAELLIAWRDAVPEGTA